MKLMVGYHDEAQKAIAQGQSWAKVREATSDLQAKLRQLKFEVPGDGEDVITKKVGGPVSHVRCPAANTETVRGHPAGDDGQVCVGDGRVEDERCAALHCKHMWSYREGGVLVSTEGRIRVQKYRRRPLALYPFYPAIVNIA